MFMDETERVEIIDNRTHKSAEDLTGGGGGGYAGSFVFSTNWLVFFIMFSLILSITSHKIVG